MWCRLNFRWMQFDWAPSNKPHQKHDSEIDEFAIDRSIKSICRSIYHSAHHSKENSELIARYFLSPVAANKINRQPNYSTYNEVNSKPRQLKTTERKKEKSDSCLNIAHVCGACWLTHHIAIFFLLLLSNSKIICGAGAASSSLSIVENNVQKHICSSHTLKIVHLFTNFELIMNMKNKFFVRRCSPKLIAHAAINA